MDSPTDLSVSTHGSSHQHIRLACQACQRKKIKCGRTYPCEQCQKSGLECLPSTRKPRARHVTTGKRGDSELRSRISKLESLVETLSGETGAPEQAPMHSDTAESPSVQHDVPITVGKYIGGPFWATLIGEVQSLRDALEEDASEEEPDIYSPASATSNSTSATPDILICPPSSVFVMPGALQDPTPQVARQLFDIFLNNVDPVYKVLHRPTILRFIEGNDTYLGHTADSPPARALKTAMWFAAVTALTDADCLVRFPTTPRAELLQLYRRHVDLALAQADLFNTRDLATLQAVVLYTAAARITDQSRRPWTMTALIVRIAYGMNLHKESSQADSPYLKEMKRRLWHQIRTLDAFAAIDRGTPLTISMDTFDTPLPSNINDSEFDESSIFITNREEGLSDVTFNLMAHSATTLTTRFLTPETNGAKGETWQQRLDTALDLGKMLREKYLQFCDHSIPFHRFINAVGNSMAASSVLRAVRPMQRHISSVPPRVDSPFVLQLAVDNIRESEATHEDPEAEGWRWIFWAQWHALAVALAGLCSIRGTELANTAWIYVEKSYERHARHIADTRGGMLWRPIEKLYKTAKAFRDGAAPHKASEHSPSEISMSELEISALSTRSLAANMLPNELATLSPGNVPTDSTAGQHIGISYDAGFAGLSPLQVGDMTWMDFEMIMEDISCLNPQTVNGQGLTSSGTQASANLEGDWPYPSNQGLM